MRPYILNWISKNAKGESSNNMSINTNLTLGSNPIHRSILSFPDKLVLPETSTSNSLSSCFENCQQIVKAPFIEMKNYIKLVDRMFNGCTNLVDLPLYDLSNITSMQYFVSGCPNLSNESLNNILYMCAHSNLLFNKTLAYIGLTQSQATTCESLSNWNSFVAAGWSSGF